MLCNFEAVLSGLPFLPLCVSVVASPAVTEIVTNCLLHPLGCFFFPNLLSFCIFNFFFFFFCGIKIRKLLSETQRIRVSGFVTATSGVDVRGWL